MPIHLKRTVSVECRIQAFRESLAQELNAKVNDKKTSVEIINKLKIEIDVLNEVLKFFEENRQITEQNERARQSKT